MPIKIQKAINADFLRRSIRKLRKRKLVATPCQNNGALKPWGIFTPPKGVVALVMSWPPLLGLRHHCFDFFLGGIPFVSSHPIKDIFRGSIQSLSLCPMIQHLYEIPYRPCVMKLTPFISHMHGNNFVV